MRTIKFRGWNTIENKMDYNVCISTDGCVISFECGNYSGTYSREQFVPLQYTGLTDRNGKKIYEGDIVKGAHRANEEWVQMQEVKYSKGCFMFGNWNAHEYFNKHTYIEIIGNIYSNPELVIA